MGQSLCALVAKMIDCGLEITSLDFCHAITFILGLLLLGNVLYRLIPPAMG